MTHEIKLLFQTLKEWQAANKKAVFVSVVALDGTSYRKPGVRMIIREDGESAGAVSGGCVEDQIRQQAASVFDTETPKIMRYDGRLRIGCEGIIHLLIEPVKLSADLLSAFEQQLELRKTFRMETFFIPETGNGMGAGSVVILNGEKYSLHPSFSLKKTDGYDCFSQNFEPLFQLYIFGAEHDAIPLCQFAKLLGWEVTIVASANERKSCDTFPGASTLITPAYSEIDSLTIDDQTAIVLMTHTFNKDVQYLIALENKTPAYLGLLGSQSRKERILSMVLEYLPEISTDFLNRIHGPAGISIGAENPSEIALSILSEILSCVRQQTPISLRNKTGSIHA